jgi:hypothetical protein
MNKIAYCPRCGKLIALIFPMHNCTPPKPRPPCEDCPWIEAHAKHDLLDMPGVKQAALDGKVFMCHTEAGHPPCRGVAIWRKNFRGKSSLSSNGDKLTPRRSKPQTKRKKTKR